MSPVSIPIFSIKRTFKSKVLITLSIIFLIIICAQNALGQKSQECIAKVGNIQNGNVSKEEFKAQEGVIALMKINASHWEPVIINSFSLMILRDTSIIFQVKNSGSKFEKRIKAAMQNLQDNDSVLIFSIYAKLANGKSKRLNPLEFKIE